MTDGDGTTVDVDDGFVDAELPRRRQTDSRERLVDLDQIKISSSDTLTGTSLFDGIGGLCLQAESGPARLRRAHRSRRARSPRAPRPWPLLMTTTAAAPSEICDELPAVSVPSLRNAGRSRASESADVLARTPSSSVNSIGSPLRCGMPTGTISSANTPFFCGGRELVAAGGELVLLLAGETVGVVALLGQQPHRLIGERVVQSVEGCVIEDLGVAMYR